MSTATSESLFLAPVDPFDLFEKTATIARMPDDDKKWPETVLSELHKQLPFLSGMDIALNFTRIQPQAGYGFGYAVVRGQKNATGLPTPKNENQLVKIPIVVADRHLEPFHVFNFEGRTFPLTQNRFEEALENPRIFAGAAKSPKTQKSLIDQLYPPYQQRQGFGRVVDGSGMSGGINKVAKAKKDMSEDELKRLQTLKRYKKIDKARSKLGRESRFREELDNLSYGATAGGVLGVGRSLFQNREALKAVDSLDKAKDIAKRLGTGGAVGGILGGATTMYGAQQKRKKARARRKDRQSSVYKEHFKRASIEDIPNYRPSDNEDVNCGTCGFYGSSTIKTAGFCNKHSADVKADMVSDDWKPSATSVNKQASFARFLMGAK